VRKKTEFVFPSELDTSDFHAVWDTWCAYRKERKLSAPKPISANAKFRELAEWGEPMAIQAINEAIANNWQGIFRPKEQARPTSNVPQDQPERVYWQAPNPEATLQAELIHTFSDRAEAGDLQANKMLNFIRTHQ